MSSVQLWIESSAWLLQFRRLVGGSLRSILPEKLPHDAQVVEMVARPRDRGIFVQLEVKGAGADMVVPAPVADSHAAISADIVAGLRKHFHTTNTDSWWYVFRPHLIQGRPLLDDLGSKMASTKLHIDFESAVPQFDELYYALRKFGRMSDLKFESGASGKTWATAQYKQLRSACAAKGCLHNALLQPSGARSMIKYEQFIKTNAIKKFVVEHPRISVPMLAGSAVGLSYLIFDPIRIYSIEKTLSTRFDMSRWWSLGVPELITKYKRYTSKIMYRWAGKSQDGHGGEGNGHLLTDETDAAQHRLGARAKLKEWLKDDPGHVLLVSGPEGYEKTRLVQSVASESGRTMVLQCDHIISGNERDFVSNLATQVGYFPVFAALNNLSTFLDTIVTSTTGAKAGLSTSTQAQCKKILELTAVALTLVVTKEKAKSKSGADADDADLNIATSNIPTVIISNFCDSRSTAGISSKLVDDFNETLMDWAVYLAANKLARVIFVSTTADGLATGGEAGRELAKYVVNRVNLDRISLGDSSRDAAVSYLHRHLSDKDGDNAKLSHVVDAVGGRLNDLHSLVSKVRSGLSLDEALEELLNRAEIDIRRRGLLEQSVLGAAGSGDDTRKQFGWTQLQFWYIMKRITRDDSVPYDALVQHGLFGNDPGAIQAMERAELISVVHESGRPTTITASKPLYLSAFKRITVGDTIFDLLIAKKLYESETGKIREMERELAELTTLLQDERLLAAIELSSATANSWLGSSKKTVKLGGENIDSQHPLVARYRFVSERLRDSQRNAEQQWDTQMLLKKSLGAAREKVSNLPRR